jgi:predicted DNA-binding transcriptional regulator AlpA
MKRLISPSDVAPQEDLLTTQEMADWLRWSTQAVLDAAARGDLPRPVKLSKRSFRWSRRDVEEFLRRRPA